MRFSSTDYVDQAAFNAAVTGFCSTRPSGKECCTGGVNDNTVDVAAVCTIDYDNLEYFQICEGACRGETACINIGNSVTTPNSIRVSILPDACTGDSSCNSIGGSSVRLTWVKIQEGACVGENNSCNSIGAGASKNINIGKSSCTGNRACFVVGASAARRIVIGDNNCQGESSCINLGQSDAKVILVGDSACLQKQCAWCCENDKVNTRVEINMGDLLGCPCDTLSPG